MEWIKDIGTLDYDPDRGRLDSGRQRNWLVLNVGPGMSSLARYWIHQNPVYYGFAKLDVKKPIFYPHVSIVRGEQLKNPDMWKKYQGCRVEYEYTIEPHITRGNKGESVNAQFFFVYARSPWFSNLRKELGLHTHRPDGSELHYHITVGKLY